MPHGKCEGNRKKRTEIINTPEILELMISVLEEHQITNPSGFEHELEINDVTYVFVGALLYNGSHYRALVLVGGKYLVYNVMWFLRSNRRCVKMKWHPDDQDFGGGWFAGKLWYVKESSEHQLT